MMSRTTCGLAWEPRREILNTADTLLAKPPLFDFVDNQDESYYLSVVDVRRGLLFGTNSGLNTLECSGYAASEACPFRVYWQ